MLFFLSEVLIVSYFLSNIKFFVMSLIVVSPLFSYFTIKVSLLFFIYSWILKFRSFLFIWSRLCSRFSPLLLSVSVTHYLEYYKFVYLYQWECPYYFPTFIKYIHILFYINFIFMIRWSCYWSSISDFNPLTYVIL